MIFLNLKIVKNLSKTNLILLPIIIINIDRKYIFLKI